MSYYLKDGTYVESEYDPAPDAPLANCPECGIPGLAHWGDCPVDRSLLRHSWDDDMDGWCLTHDRYCRD
jgi:hypothetical protein